MARRRQTLRLGLLLREQVPLPRDIPLGQLLHPRERARRFGSPSQRLQHGALEKECFAIFGSARVARSNNAAASRLLDFCQISFAN